MGKCLEEARKATIFTSKRRALLTPRALSGVDPRSIWRLAGAHGNVDSRNNRPELVHSARSNWMRQHGIGATPVIQSSRILILMAANIFGVITCRKEIAILGSLLVLCLSITAHAMEKDETITLTDSKKIGYAVALSEAIDEVSKKVTECVEKKRAPPETCFCLYPAEVSKVREKYEVALKNNPEWRDRIVYWTVKGNPMSYNLAFAGLHRQVERKCDKK